MKKIASLEKQEKRRKTSVYPHRKLVVILCEDTGQKVNFNQGTSVNPEVIIFIAFSVNNVIFFISEITIK